MPLQNRFKHCFFKLVLVTGIAPCVLLAHLSQEGEQAFKIVKVALFLRNGRLNRRAPDPFLPFHRSGWLSTGCGRPLAAASQKAALRSSQLLIPRLRFFLLPRRLCGWIPVDPGGYRLDVDEFSALVEVCRTHRHRKAAHCSTCHARYHRAADLYRGDFLAGFLLPDSQAFDEWLVLKGEGLRRQFLEVFERMSDFHEARGEHENALRYVFRQLEIKPWREDAHRQAMTLFLSVSSAHQPSHSTRCAAVCCKKTWASSLSLRLWPSMS